MRGFTTIRDMGGPVFGLKRAIDEGIVPGRADGASAQAEGDFCAMQANPTNAAEITESAAGADIPDVKAVNPDGDGTIEKNEFTNACNQGLIKRFCRVHGREHRCVGCRWPRSSR